MRCAHTGWHMQYVVCNQRAHVQNKAILSLQEAGKQRQGGAGAYAESKLAASRVVTAPTGTCCRRGVYLCPNI
jgi:hypothetical protein